MKPIIISAFPGTGKSFLSKQYVGKISDSDSSRFDKAHFPANYLAHIKTLLHNPNLKYIMVSSHAEIREAMDAEGIDYNVVFPTIDQMSDYIVRYTERGSPQAFIDLMTERWTTMVESCREGGGDKYELQDGQYLSDVIGDIERITATASLTTPTSGYPKTHAQLEPSDEAVAEREAAEQEEKKDEDKPKKKGKVSRGKDNEDGDEDSESDDSEEKDDEEGEDKEDDEDDDADPYADIDIPDDDGDPDGLGSDDDDDDTDYSNITEEDVEGDEDEEDEEIDDDIEASASRRIRRHASATTGKKRIPRYMAAAGVGGTTVVCTYFSCGRTEATQILEGNYRVLNLDLKLNESYANLAETVKTEVATGRYDFILLNANYALRKALIERGVMYHVVRPCITMRDELMVRMMRAGRSAEFILACQDGWDEDVQSLAHDNYLGNPGKVTVLHKGQYLADVLPELLTGQMFPTARNEIAASIKSRGDK